MNKWIFGSFTAFFMTATAFAAPPKVPMTVDGSAATQTVASAPVPNTKLNRGQSFIICEMTNGTTNVFDAVASLNVRLINGLNAITTTVSGKVFEIDAPYSVSAPTITSYDRTGTPDIACVTLTKQ